MTTPDKVDSTKTAHIYVRFSTSEQQDGDSEARQLRRAKAYCAERGWRIGETVVDRGVSGYHGRNHEQGELGQLLRRMSPGEVVILEDRDRWSRERVSKSQDRLEQAIERGIEIVFLNTGTHVTKDNLDDDNNVLTGLLSSFVANRESKKKSGRIADSWAAKHKALEQGKPARLNRLPCWLRWDAEQEKAVVVESKAEVVRRMFALAAQGQGILEIVRAMASNPPLTAFLRKNAKSKPAWNPTTVRRILTSRAVCGYYTRAGEAPVANVWPVIIEETTFAVAQSKLAIQAGDKRPGHKSERNLLTGLAKCACCGQHNLYVHLSGTGETNPRLICGGAVAGRSTCGFTGAPLPLIERSLLSFLGDADLIRPLLASPEQKPSRLEELQARHADAQKQAAKLAGLIMGDPEPSPMLYARLKQEEAKAKTLAAEIDAEQLRQRGEQPALVAYGEFASQLPALAKDPARRPELRRAIASVVQSITLDPHGGAKGSWAYNVTLKGQPEPIEIFCTAKPEGWIHRSLRPAQHANMS